MALGMYDIITKKKRKQELTSEEIKFFVDGVTAGTIPDYQTSALLMAILLNKMNERETYDLAMAMAYSGDMLDLSEINGVTVDKHSTGGVGDKTTLVVGPVVASAGAAFAKMSGRGLGHTGGTLDKLEAVPGFNINLSEKQFFELVKKNNIALTAQSGDLAPADKKLYALRDVTATIDDISLIASSIMSKKLASGAKVIVLDVKCGSGAFMKTEADAIKLAEAMIDIGRRGGRKMYALISDMNSPLGEYVGNRLEVYESVKTLLGQAPKDITESCMLLSALILKGAGLAGSIEEGLKLAESKIESGEALERFKTFITGQGGDISFLDDLEAYIGKTERVDVLSESEGYITSVNTEMIGMASLYLGGGRTNKEDDIDPYVGLKILKKPGDYVKKGEALATLYYTGSSDVNKARETVVSAYVTGESKPAVVKHFYGYIDESGYHEL